MITNIYAKKLIRALKNCNKTIAGAESCTGGMVCAALTSIAGSSAVVKGALVSYTNDVKNGVLGVNQNTLDVHGAVSTQTVLQMAQGASKLLCADVAYSVSGIAGPSGGTKECPVGTVCFGFFIDGKTITETVYFKVHFCLARIIIRKRATKYALKRLLTLLAQNAT